MRSGRITAKEAELLRSGDPDVIAEVMVAIRVRHAGAKMDAAVAAGALDRNEVNRALDRLRAGDHSPELRSWINRITRRDRDDGEDEGRSAPEGHST